MTQRPRFLDDRIQELTTIAPEDLAYIVVEMRGLCVSSGTLRPNRFDDVASLKYEPISGHI